MAGMFSTKGMYALRAMADLACHEGWVSLGDVSRRQGISRKYLEQVISLMHGRVTSSYLDSKTLADLVRPDDAGPCTAKPI